MTQAQPQTTQKTRYHVRNWHQYNRALVQRGSLTLWFEPGVVAAWLNDVRSGRRGASDFYSDLAIECALTLQAVYDLPLRATQGLLQALMELMGLALPVPCYSTFSRRRQDLAVRLPRRSTRRTLHVVVDSTGVKVFGEGEWQRHQHRSSKRRTWIKLHLGVDEATGDIVATVVTASRQSDKETMPAVLDQIPNPLCQVSADGGYDYLTCYDAIAARGAVAAIPPRRSGRPWNNGQMPARDKNLRQIATLGRPTWKKKIHYHRRSLVETTMCRLKTIFGARATARKRAGQITELTLWCGILNRMTRLGMPQSVPVATR